MFVTKLFGDEPAINQLQLQIGKTSYHLKTKSLEPYSRWNSKAKKYLSFKILDKLVLLII